MNSRLRTLSLRAMLALALILPAAAQATPVTILSGQTMVFNVDLTGSTPAPPYTFIEFTLGIDLAASDATDGLFLEFAELDGNELRGGFATSVEGLAGIDFFSDHAEFVDGLFSFSMQAIGGNVTMDPKANGLLRTERGDIRTDFFEPVGILIDSTGPGTVPEPSTVALVLLAAAAMAARGHRRAGHRRLARVR